jgi:hypothetical protein
MIRHLNDVVHQRIAGVALAVHPASADASFIQSS